MLKDLRQINGFCSSLEKVYLVDQRKRITSPYFNVWVPSLMNGINRGLEDMDEEISLDGILNDNKSGISNSVKLSQSIRAKSIHPYRFRHDGWIPEFKTEHTTYEEMTMESGTGDEMSASSSQGETELGGGPPHTHTIIKPFKMLSNKFKKFFFKDNTSTRMVHTNSTEVDYQELNKVYINKGHVLYGCFVSGGDSTEFVILAIEDVIPYYDEDEDNNGNNTMDWPWGIENGN
ncbi:MAG: hypothetical protein ACRCX2_17925 [Paraclostridium sp.]